MIYIAAQLRKLVQVGIIMVCIVGFTPKGARAEPIKPFARKNSLPIVDVHGHLNGDMSAEQLIELMDNSGVSRMVLMPRYFGGRRSGGSGSDEQALEYAKTYPGRFIPFVAGQRDMLDERDRWLNPDRQAENLLQEMETELRTQQFYGIGELIIRHYAFGGPRGGRERDIPVNTPLMGRFAELAGRYEVPLLIHAEGEPDVVTGMKQLLEKNPKTRIIWAHNCGRSSPEIIRAMLAGYFNLSCDLGGMLNAPFAPYGRYWPKRTPWMFLIEDGNGNLFPEMKALYEAFPNRFFLGTDPAFTPALRTYTRRIERFRELLSGLTPETARRLGFQNADELFQKHGKE
jgi:Tat protein secretion system quality control protein TatD with DNase activity